MAFMDASWSMTPLTVSSNKQTQPYRIWKTTAQPGDMVLGADHRDDAQGACYVFLDEQQAVALIDAAAPAAGTAAPEKNNVRIVAIDRVLLDGTSGRDYDGDHFTEEGKFGTALRIETAANPLDISITRFFIQFDLSSIPAGSDIVSAELSLALLPSDQNITGVLPHRVRLGLLDKELSSVQPRDWATFQQLGIIDGTANTTLLRVKPEPLEREALDATLAVRAIISGGQPNNGFQIRFVTEERIGHNKHAWCSSRFRGGIHKPRLIIHYIPKR